MISAEDLRRAVTQGLITPSQAQGLAALAGAPDWGLASECGDAAMPLRSDQGAAIGGRAGTAANKDGLAALGAAVPTANAPQDIWAPVAPALGQGGTTSPATAQEEPLLLYRGFNEVFIVVGLFILFGGWMGILWIDGWTSWQHQAFGGVLVHGGTLAALWLCQQYFTLKRRMIAPSIVLSVMSAFVLSQWGVAAVTLLDVPSQFQGAATAAIVVAGMVVHYLRFRVPFNAAIIAVMVFRMVELLQSGQNGSVLSPPGADLSMTTSVILGLLCFALAMRFDLSDPLRVTRRAATGFWLHVAAAMAIVSPVAQTLIGGGQAELIGLTGFLAVLALIALVIDRRSLLVSGAGYAVWLIIDLTGGSIVTIFLLGLGLVLLGAQWDRLRALLLQALPEFPGKHRLPPYGITA